MNHESQLWYVKVNDEVKGPFASGLISKYILLGRIQPNDLLSQDKKRWRVASSINAVIPDLVKHQNDPRYQERLKAAKRWADEREGVREIGADGQEKIFKPRKKITKLKIKTTGTLGLSILILVIAVLIYAMFVFTPADPLEQIDCQAPSHNGAIFDGCRMQRKNFSNKSLKDSSFKNASLQNTVFQSTRLQNSQLDYANLSHADFTGANLTGASLRAADLRGAILSNTQFLNADLSYADLTGAQASNIDLTGAKLNNTIWFDGSVCSKKSVGRCLLR